MEYRNRPAPPRRRWTVAGIAVVVALAVFGLLVVAGIVLIGTMLNHWGTNK